MGYAIRLLVIACCLHALPAEARRVALVIGNAEYKIGPLANPLNDAAAVAEAFEKQLKFDKVILRRNLGFEALRAALAELSREASGADLGVVYFAGHGTEVGGKNYLIPVDATLARASALDLEAIPLDTVLGQLDGVRKLKLVILDACRNNPFALPGAKRSVGRGLARIEPEDNTLVVYAARDGTTADDGAGRKHSPFTEALLKHIATPGLEINFVFRRVRDDVVATTNPVQYPHVYGTLGGKEFYLQPQVAHLAVPAPVAVPGTPQPASQMNEAERAWAAVKDSTSIAALEAFRARYPGSFYADLAQVRIIELGKSEDQKKVAIAPPVSPPPAASQTPAFGTPDVVFAVGIWRLMIVKNVFHGALISLWTDNGDRAIEVVLGASGWWKVRRQSREEFVHGDGGIEPKSFSERPWERAQKAAFPISKATSHEGKGVYGPTRIDLDSDQIRITLSRADTGELAGGGEIHLNGRSRTITFKTDRGRWLTF